MEYNASYAVQKRRQIRDGWGKVYVFERPFKQVDVFTSAPYRGNPVASAAKCIVVMVKLGKKTSRYHLAVVPGDTRVDLNAVKALAGGTYVANFGTVRN